MDIARPLAAVLVLSLASATALAEQQRVYQWKDANGVTHYTDTPPPGRAYDTLSTRSTTPASQAGRVDPRCMAARTNITRLKSGEQGLGPDADGDGKPDSVLDPAQRASRLQAAESAEREYCKDAGAR